MNISELKGKRVYLGGPMRGLSNYNFQAFEDAMWVMRWHGVVVRSPHELDMQADAVRVQYTTAPPAPLPFPTRRIFTSVEWNGDIGGATRRDMQELAEVDAVVFMMGWKDSVGSFVEYVLARGLDLPVYEYDPAVEGLTLVARDYKALTHNEAFLV